MNHLTSRELQEFITGRSDPAASEQIMAHLDQCDTCLARADEVWAQQPVSATAQELLELDAPTAQRLERRLVNQIHRFNLAAAIVRLGAQGFLAVAAGLLRPLVASRRPDSSASLAADDGVATGPDLGQGESYD